MAENTPNQESKLPEKSILPVSKEAVDEALAEIAQDPQKVLVDEITTMERQNPPLATLVKSFSEKLDATSHWDYMEGAYWTHKILRKQAELCGRQFPTISPDLLKTFFRDTIQHNAEQKQKRKLMFSPEEIQKTIAQDPEFARAIREFTKYRYAALVFYLGVFDVYVPIKNAIEAEELAKKLDPQTPDSTEEKSDDKKINTTPLDKVLKAAITERKPLSEDERKEAMTIARDIWKKAMEKLNGKECVLLKTKDGNSTIIIDAGKQAKEILLALGKDFKADLIISVQKMNPQQLPEAFIHDYYLMPDGVKKTTFDLSGVKPISLNMLWAIEDPIQRTIIANREKARAEAQRTEETHEPDKADLTNLLQDLSFAQEDL